MIFCLFYGKLFGGSIQSAELNAYCYDLPSLRVVLRLQESMFAVFHLELATYLSGVQITFYDVKILFRGFSFLVSVEVNHTSVTADVTTEFIEKT